MGKIPQGIVDSVVDVWQALPTDEGNCGS